MSIPQNSLPIPPEAKGEGSAPNDLPKPAENGANVEVRIIVGGSGYYPISQYDQEVEKHVLPIQTAGILGLGHVDLSAYKAEKLKVRAESIPSDIIEKMVFC